MNKFPIVAPQWNRLSENAGNVAEAPPVADKARRCWRKTRSIAPAPRAIGDYVLRGLNGLRSKPHEPVLFERSDMKIISVWGENTIPYYAPNKTANGGDYF